MFQKNKILVIDDERLVRESIAVYLEDSGYQVFEASDGKQGLSMYFQKQPDLVLCDLRMPEMDGLEVLKRLTETDSNVPIIIVSGAGQIHDVVEALRLGALDYLVKPVTDLAVLENAVVNALTRRELEKQNKQYRQELELANGELEKNLRLLQQDQQAGRRAQLQLLPEPDSCLGKFRFQHTIIPSLNLSGDFIDYFRISDRYLGFYIADVSGHGAAAAFVTMTLKSLINQPMRQFRQGMSEIIIQPDEFMQYLNSELLSANLGKHITAFYGVIDCEKQTLNYSVAGQYPAPALYNLGQLRLLNETGFPLGLFEWAVFQNRQIDIAEDFQLLMLSDGWLELVTEDAVPASESVLLSLLGSQPISMAAMTQPVIDYPRDNRPDDITIFIVSKEAE